MIARAALGLVLLVSAAACDPASFAPGSTTAPAPPPPLAPVRLPPVPPLEELDVAPTFPDGAYSVAGLTLNRDKLFDSRVKVRAILESVYACDVPVDPAKPAEPGVVRPGCTSPHFFVADSLRSARKLLVVGHDAATLEAKLKPGTRYTLDGVFSRRGAGHMSAEFGLLVLESIEGDGLPPPAAADAGP